MHFGKWIDGENYTGNSRTQRSIDVQKWILECIFISPYKCLPWSIRELSIQVDKSHCSCIKIWSTICSAGHHTIVRTWRLWTRCRRGSPGSCLDWRLDYKETSYIMEIRFKVREGKFKRDFQATLFYLHRVVGAWNALPAEMVETDMIATYMRHEDRHMSRQWIERSVPLGDRWDSFKLAALSSQTLWAKKLVPVQFFIHIPWTVFIFTFKGKQNILNWKNVKCKLLNSA